MGNSDDHLKVLGMRESPYVNRVQVALNLKSLDYEFIPERNLLIEKSELLLKSNPVHKKVPVLIHNDKPISESLVIVEYIDEVWTTAGHSILPCDPYERADARFWAAYVDLTLFPALRELIGLTQDEDTKKAAAEKVIEGMLLLEDAFEKSSKGKAFFGGNEIGYLDIAFGCVLGWLKAVEIINKVKFLDEIKTPRLVEWATAFMSHGATENVVPGPEQLIEYSKTLPAKLAAAAAAAAAAVVSSN